MTSTKYDHDSEPRTRIAAPAGPAAATYVLEADDASPAAEDDDGVGDGDRTVMLVTSDEIEPSLPSVREPEDLQGGTLVMASPLRAAAAPSLLPIVPIRPVVRPMGVRPPPPSTAAPPVRPAPLPPVPLVAVPRGAAGGDSGPALTWLVTSLVVAALVCVAIAGALVARARVPAAVAAPPVTAGAR